MKSKLPQILIPALAAAVGILLWRILPKFLHSLFDPQALPGRLLDHPVNAVTLAVFCASLAMLSLRLLEVRRNALWERQPVLPEGEAFTSFSQVDPFLRTITALADSKTSRPLRLLRACYESARSKWSPASAQDALQTELQLQTADVNAAYNPVFHAITIVQALGFFGTVLGIAGAMGAIRSGFDSALVKLQVAFDTTLFSLAASLVALTALGLVQRYEFSILHAAFERVHRDFVLQIRERRLNRQDKGAA